MFDPQRLSRLTIVTGHYGSGKTNLSLNLAFDLAAAGKQVTIVDLDVVNPYFRSSDHTERLAAKGIALIAPNFANTTLDVPSLSGAVDGVFSQVGERYVVFDVGGDDVGATALGRYRDKIANLDHQMLYVINRNRNLTTTAEEAGEILREIEAVSGVAASGIVNNSHLQDETELATIIDSVPFANDASKMLGLPLICTTVPNSLLEDAKNAPALTEIAQTLYPIKRYVHTLWDVDPQ